MPLSPSAGRRRLPRPPRRWTVLPSMASRSRSTRPAPVVMEVVAAVAVEDMVEAVVEEDMEVEAMAVAAVVVDMEAAAVDMVAAVEVVDMEVVDMVEMVATEEAVEVVVATVVVAVAMAAAAMEVDVVAEDMVEVATRPPLQQDYLQKKHFRFKISIRVSQNEKFLNFFCPA